MACSAAMFPTLATTLTMLLCVHAAMAATTINITEILLRDGQHNMLIQILMATGQGVEVQNILNSSDNGVTLFAPTDEAISGALGALNGLDIWQRMLLVRFHMVPKFYNFSTIRNANNSIETLASCYDSTKYLLNFTAASDNDEFNVATGVNTVFVNDTLYASSPLAIYPVGQVLQPMELFGNAMPPPTPATMPNISEILLRGGQHNMLIQLLMATGQGAAVQDLLDNSDQGITLFAPTDEAISGVEDALNGLDDQQKVSLLQFHVVPKFYSFSTIRYNASNPIQTLASNNNSTAYVLNFTATYYNDGFNVSTGVNTVVVNDTLYASSPLAIYPTGQVLQPVELFGNAV